MSVSEKQSFESRAEDLELFDEMEKNFHRTVSDLVNDRSLDKFREEYEKLHEALVTSHEHNKVLIDKCRQLNNDILSNVNKISSILSLSQNDQRTISGLRHEFEKAWKMVEVSQEREARSKDVIETLKAEITNLTKLVERGGALAFSQETSLQDVSDSVVLLKNEIRVQTAQIEKMRNDGDEALKMRKACENETQRLKQESIDLVEQIEKEKSLNIQYSNDSEQHLIDIKATKASIIESQGKVEDIVVDIKNQAQRNNEIKDSFYEEQRLLKSIEEDAQMNIQAIRTQKKILEDKVKQNKKVANSMKKYDSMFIEKDEMISSYSKSLIQITQETDELKVTFSELRNILHEIENERSRVKQALTQSRDQVFISLSKKSKSELNTQTEKIKYDKETKDIHSMKLDADNEKHKTKAVEEQERGITSEVMGMKVISHQGRKKIVAIEAETEQYRVKSATSKNHLMQLSEEITIRENSLDEKTLQLADINDRRKRQESLNESVQNERDLSSKQLQESIRDNERIIGENSVIQLQIQQLKEDIRKGDQKCVETHLKRKIIEKDLVELKDEVDQKRINIKDMDNRVTETRNLIQRSLHLISESELDIMKQKQVMKDLFSTVSQMERVVVKKGREAQALHKQVLLLTAMIQKGGNAYKTTSSVVIDSKNELETVLANRKYLDESNRHNRALRLEIVRIEKSLLLEQGKCRALEDELEKPLNVHRWRFLDGTNPELSQLIRMNHNLRDKLMMLIYRLDRFRRHKDSIKQKAEILEGHLKKSYGGSYEEECQYLNNLLRIKNQQLMDLESQVHKQQFVVGDQRGQIMTVRTMVREEKSGYYEAKKKVVQIRAQTATGTRQNSKLPTATKKETKFVGGGFAVGGVVVSETKNNNQRPATPQLITPSSSPRKKTKHVSPFLPEKWND